MAAREKPGMTKKSGARTEGIERGRASSHRGPGGASKQFPVIGIGASAGGQEAFGSLFSTMLDDPGLLSTLVRYLRRDTARIGEEVDFKHIGFNRTFSGEVSNNVSRIAQEALTNVSRHAAVDGVTIQAWANRRRLTMAIEDKCTGFDMASLVASSSNGLEGMRERAFLLGGTLSIDSAPGYGTCLAPEAPLQDHGAGSAGNMEGRSNDNDSACG
jgi:two-component system, NarL family, sensor histidine kinase UhpB